MVGDDGGDVLLTCSHVNLILLRFLDRSYYHMAQLREKSSGTLYEPIGNDSIISERGKADPPSG